MSINIGPASSDDLRPKIMVIGVGGAGGNAIANMMEAGIEGVDFIVSNTDAQALSTSPAAKRIQLGPDITGGLGAGARPEVGKAAAEETVDEIEDALDGCNMVFIAAGMGGGTGTGAAPVIAEAARKKGVLTVGVVTKPFLFEGTRRMRAAEAGIEELQKHVDTLIVIPNQNLFLVAKAETTFKEAFMLADEVLQQGVRSITDLMVMPGLINLDFADVRSVMSEMGKAMMGTGEGEGDNRALDAAERAIANPLLDGVSMAGAKGVIISIIGGEDMKLLEVDEAANHIRELVDEDANIIWGSAFNPDLEGKIRVSVVATGIDGSGSVMNSAPRSFSMSESRAPKRPVLDLPSDDMVEEEPFELNEGLSAEPEVDEDSAYGLANEAGAADDSVLSDDLGYSEEDDEDFDDVDEIVDPLAGLRNEETDEYDGGHGAVPPPADAGNYGAGDGWNEDEGDGSMLDLSETMEEGGQDELQLGSDQYADGESPLASKPMRKRPILGGGGDYGSGGGDEGASGGSTLFERMANLSRGANKPADDEDDDEDDDEGGSGSLNIPRFLGRQNNQ
ncbi:cell division protein FtsZ [Qipengyuania sp. RANM35]|uniref:cell division protein FtsZ n=1 Tax=Qipengyuania sp. RANM35 TaxID=3068635 RepID=UPI0034DADBC5